MIQIDEAALREGLPLRKANGRPTSTGRSNASASRPPACGDATQIHTHMCYSEFNDIIASIGAMDADVISIETARSQMELLDAFAGYRYPAEIGPGVYDIHSPRVPAVDEMATLLKAASRPPSLRPALGQSGLRTENPQMAGGYDGHRKHGRRRKGRARQATFMGTASTFEGGFRRFAALHLTYTLGNGS